MFFIKEKLNKIMGIFKAYDIRGKYPEEINKEIAFKIGSAYGKLIVGKKIIVGSDARDSSIELKEALIAGLCKSGKKVIHIDLCTTPMLYFAVNHLEGDGGIMVTASHLGAGFNGMKMTREKSIPISHDTGIIDIEKMVQTEEYDPSDFSCESVDVKEDYLDFIVNKKISLRGKIVVDTGNGMVGLVIKEFLERLGVDYNLLYGDIDMNFPNHVANPIKTETLNDLCIAVKKEGALLGIAFDGDGDRMGLVDENGKIIPGDIIGALIALKILKNGPEKILYCIRSSKILQDVIKDNNGTPIKSRVGHSFIKEVMRREDVAFALENSGHFYFRETYYVESSLRAVMKILEMVSETGKNLSELVKPLQKYFKTDEINFRVEDKKGKMAEIEKIYTEKGAEIEKIDGVTVEFNDWWFNLRSSNTENLLRLNLEADTKELMEEKTKEVEEIIKS